MGGITPLLAAYAGYGAGRQQRLQNQQAQEQLELQKEQERLYASQIGVEEQQAGIDPSTGKPYPFAIPKNLQQVFPNNHGQAPDPMRDPVAYSIGRANQLQGLAVAAMQANRPDLVKQFGDAARDAALNVGTFSTAAYNWGPRTQQAYATADYDRARAFGARELANDRVAIAGMHDQAAMARVQAQINSRQDIAQYNNEERSALAQYAAGVMINQKLPAQAAVAMAIAQLRANEQTLLTEMNPKTQLLNPDVSTGAFNAGTPTINLNFGSNGYPQRPTQFPSVVPPWAPQPNQGAPQNQGASQKPSVNKTAYDNSMAIARKAMAGGMSVDQIRQQLQANTKLDPATKAAVMQALGAPTAATGGSQAAGPFLRVPVRPQP